MLLVKKLLAVLHGDPLGTAEFIDQETGGHLAEFFKTSQERLDKGIGEDINGAVLEMARKVDHSATQLRIVIEILDQLVGDKAAMDVLDAKWDAAEAAGERSPRPDLRDIVVGATSIAPAYASTTGPLRRLYIQALRGSYAPPIYTFGLGPELLDALYQYLQQMGIQIPGMGARPPSAAAVNPKNAAKAAAFHNAIQ